jgi:hypothetical protein
MSYAARVLEVLRDAASRGEDVVAALGAPLAKTDQIFADLDDQVAALVADGITTRVDVARAIGSRA